MSEPSAEPRSLFQRIVARVRLDLLAPPAEQFAGLNGLRGLAAYLVCFIHVAVFSNNFPLVPRSKLDLTLFHRSINGFWVGLDLFFVLSGFLIGRILFNSLKRTGTVEFWYFFTRRSMRIFPAYYLTLTFGLFVFAELDLRYFRFFLRGATPADLVEQSWQNYFYVLNYFVGAHDPTIMSQAWSLCVEEHFYLLLPLILVIAFRFPPRFRLPILLGFTSISFIVRVVQYLLDPSIVLLDGFYYRSHNRFDEPMIGVLIAYLYVYHHDSFRDGVQWMGSWTWGIGAALIGAVWVFGGLQDQGWFAVIVQFSFMALGAGLLITNCLFLRNGCTRLFEHPSWYPVSRVSYGIFLNHIFVLYVLMDLPIFQDAPQMGALRFTFFGLSVMAVAFLVACITFVAIERPLIDLGHRVSRRFRKPTLVSTGGS